MGYPFLKGHGTENDFVLLPDHDGSVHGGLSPGAPKGNKNALKHGRYTADAIARRRAIGELLRISRQVIG